MDIETATQNAAKGTLHPVYLVGGEERLLIQRFLDTVRLATVGGGPRGLSEDLFDGRGLTASTLMTAARTLPMMSKRRLITVRAVDQMTPTEQEALIPYFTKPEPSTVMLLVAQALDQRRLLAKEAKKHGFLLVAEHPDEREIGPWIAKEAKRRAMTMDPGASESLGLLVGPDLTLLSDALDRLQLYAGDRPVTAADVDLCITPVREIAAWDLGDMVAQRNLAGSLAVVSRLMDQRQPALPTLAVIARQVYQLAKARRFASRPKQGESLAGILRCPPSAASNIAAAAKKWTPDQLARALRIVAATDAALKGSKRGDERILEECLIALCGGPGMGEVADLRRAR